MIKNIVFDIGNVLTYYTWEKHIRNLGYDGEVSRRLAEATVKNEDWNELDRGVMTTEEIVELLVDNDRGIEAQIREMMADLSGLVERADYAIPWIKELRGKGYRVYYLSNFSDKAERDCKAALDFIPYTDGGILSWKDRLIKPQPEIYRLLLERFGLKAWECVFLDDVEANVEGARRCGLYAIRFFDKGQAEQELKKLGVE